MKNWREEGIVVSPASRLPALVLSPSHNCTTDSSAVTALLQQLRIYREMQWNRNLSIARPLTCLSPSRRGGRGRRRGCRARPRPPPARPPATAPVPPAVRAVQQGPGPPATHPQEREVRQLGAALGLLLLLRVHSFHLDSSVNGFKVFYRHCCHLLLLALDVADGVALRVVQRGRPVEQAQEEGEDHNSLDSLQSEPPLQFPAIEIFVPILDSMLRMNGYEQFSDQRSMFQEKTGVELEQWCVVWAV